MDTKEYLKNVADLEISLYVQNDAINRIVTQDVYANPKAPYAIELETSKTKAKKVFIWLWIILSLIGFFGSMFIDELGWVGVIGLVCGIISFCIPKESSAYMYKEEIMSEEKAQEAYNKDLSVIKKQNDDWMRNVMEKRNTMIAIYNQTATLLQKYYALGVLYPKYQNIVAATTIYEYFASGRCDELAGKDGAYNLFEMEVRQNIIICQLEQITQNLQQIRANQFYLYNSLCESNGKIDSLISNMYDVNKKIDAVMINQEFDRYCNNIKSTNNNYQKYL